MNASRCVALTLGLAGLITACRVGPNPARSPAASSPHGIVIFLETTVETVFAGPTVRGDLGELLAVREDGLLVDIDRTITLFPFASFARARPASKRAGPNAGFVDGRTVDGFRAWTPYARHPYGLSETQLDQLLRAAGQDSLLVRRP